VDPNDLQDLENHSMDSNAMDDNDLSRQASAPALSLPVRSRQDPGSVMTFEESMKQSDINGRRKMYPREQWLALRPIIQRLYVDEGQTFLKVAEYLHEHHDFNPTRVLYHCCSAELMHDVGKNNSFDGSRSGGFKRTSSGMRGKRFLRALVAV
jgi:hypothetical protein